MKIEIFPINSLIIFDPYRLDLSKNNIVGLPGTIGRLKALKELSLTRNKITSLPNTIGNLQNLERFSLDNNKLDKLPPAVSKLKKLRVIKINSNKFSPLPAAIRGLNIKELSIQNNDPCSVPEWLGEIKSLQLLDLRNTKLKGIPDTIHQLPNLNELHISENNLNYPKTIGDLEKHEWRWDPYEKAYRDKNNRLISQEDMGPRYEFDVRSDKITKYFKPGYAPNLIERGPIESYIIDMNYGKHT